MLVCQQLGQEPNPDDMPLEPNHLSDNSQQALILVNALPDKWEGMSGSWMGKEYSGLMDIMNIYEIDDKKRVFELLQVCEKELGEFYKQKQKEQAALSKAKRAR